MTQSPVPAGLISHSSFEEDPDDPYCVKIPEKMVKESLKSKASKAQAAMRQSKKSGTAGIARTKAEVNEQLGIETEEHHHQYSQRPFQQDEDSQRNMLPHEDDSDANDHSCMDFEINFDAVKIAQNDRQNNDSMLVVDQPYNIGSNAPDKEPNSSHKSQSKGKLEEHVEAVVVNKFGHLIEPSFADV